MGRPLPSREDLLLRLRYDPMTGKLFGRRRSVEMFAHAKNPQRACAQFNATLADKEAFTSDDGKGHRVGGVCGRNIRAHRVIWCMVYGDWPAQIDHENQDGSDNRIGNLRITDHEHNGRNARLSNRNRSGRIGVNWKRRDRKWRAKIRHGGQYIELGMFARFEDAVAARAEAERLYGYSPRHGSRRAVK